MVSVAGRLVSILCAATLLVAAAGCGGDSTTPPVVTVLDDARSPQAALEDDRIFQAPAGVDAQAYVNERMASMAQLGARVVRVPLRWDVVAPTRRPANATDPADPAYDWSAYDRIVTAAGQHKMELLFSIWAAPKWAVDSSLPATVDGAATAWDARRPASADAFGQFAGAAARRYSVRGVHLWEAWNEPNLNFFFRPQFVRRGSRWVATSPVSYGELLTAMRRNIRAVDATARVGGGATAPVGDRCGLECDASGAAPNRIGPQQFLQALDTIGGQPEMDAVTHHPYPSSPPPAADAPKAVRRLDIYNLQDLAPAIDATYLKGTPIWITEYGFQTEETAVLRYFLAPAEQAAAISKAYATLVAEPRIEIATYYFLQDNGAFQSGLTTVDGARKPGASAFALPLAVAGRTADGVRMVGQVRPTRSATSVEIQYRSGDSWTTASSVATTADGSFALRVVPADGPITLRARWSGTDAIGIAAEWTSPEVTIDSAEG